MIYKKPVLITYDSKLMEEIEAECGSCGCQCICVCQCTCQCVKVV